ncbi:uroporphyrinogen-III C-methyltransferase [Alteribacillus sp. JSM 102045]|uniref:uroporphyrinogen-III C-methyltransferase n=1 Tax=Alteribacillus sp. JSM 102045 TaxID=1562101 RepID=UPI0035C0DB78
MSRGYVYLTGAGPGDPKLLTIKAVETLRAADVVVYDRLVNQETLKEVKPEAELIYCGKLPKNHTLRQEQINTVLSEKALEGKVVTRLKGGDPFVYGRGGEEAVYLASLNIPFEVIPGISSGIAVPAYAGIPVTHRAFGGTLAMVTGHLPNERETEQWSALALGIDTLVFYMGMNQLETISFRLIEGGKSADTPAAAVEWGTTSRQRTVTASLKSLPFEVNKAKLSNPAIIIVGEVVRLRDNINWFTGEAGSVSALSAFVNDEV